MRKLVLAVKTKKVFESDDESKLRPHFGIFDYHNSDRRNKIFEFFNGISYTRTDCLVEALVEKIKHVFTEKNDFEYRNKSLKI